LYRQTRIPQTQELSAQEPSAPAWCLSVKLVKFECVFVCGAQDKCCLVNFACAQLLYLNLVLLLWRLY
jgi:hypothetical protein